MPGGGLPASMHDVEQGVRGNSAAAWAQVLAAASFVLYAATVALTIVVQDRAVPSGWAAGAPALLFPTAVLGFAVAGVLIVRRQPRNAVGWLLLASP